MHTYIVLYTVRLDNIYIYVHYLDNTQLVLYTYLQCSTVYTLVVHYLHTPYTLHILPTHVS